MRIQLNKLNDHDCDYNYAALAVSIIRETSVEKSFNLLEGINRHVVYSFEEVKTMLDMKNDGKSYAMIAKEFSTSATTIFRTLKKHREKMVVI